MKFKVLTLFPEMVRGGLNTSIIGRAIENNLISIEAVNIRNYTEERHGRVDDYTYGGGAGMLMQAQPVYDAWKAVAGLESDARKKHPRTVYVTPQGIPFSQNYARELAQEEELIFLCGHYEGIDARALEEIVTDYVSIGDYVLTGGELPAMVMIDAISRLVPGVLHNETSAETESFHRYLLEYPQYSRPEVWHGKKVPEVLLSGDHKKIAAWRLQQSEQLTEKRRPDLYAKYQEQELLIRKLSKNKRLYIHMIESLRRGRGEILAYEESAIFLYDREERLGMIAASSQQEVEKLLGALPDKTMQELKLVVTTTEAANRILTMQFPFAVLSECKQACYTQRNPLPVRHKDIRLLTGEHLTYLTEHYDHESREYLAERLDAEALYGAFVEGKLVGFSGWHSEGSLGILYVDEAYRRQGIGASLESFCINRQLEMGYVPYGHIYVDNEVSLQMQKRLGLYLSQESIWWLGHM